MVTCTTKFNIKDTSRYGCSVSWRGANELFNKEKTYLEEGAINTDGNTWGEYFLKN